MSFTRVSVDGLSAPTERSRDEYRDSAETGLQLYVSRHGIKTFYLYRKHQGKPLRIKIGRYPEISVSQARSVAQQQKAKLILERFESPASTPHRQAKAITLEVLADEYFETRKLKPVTVRGYKGGINNHLAEWKMKPMSDFTKEKVIELHARISKKAGDSMADNVMRTLRTLFEFFKDRYDFEGDNPVKTLSVNRLWKTGISNRRTRYIHRKDLPAFYRYIDGLPNQIWRDYILFILFTGVRKSEAENMRWKNVNFVEETFTIPDTKNGDPLTLPLNSFLKELLTKRRGELGGQWVFPLDGDIRKSINASGICRRIVPDSGFEFSLHDLRRTFSTLAESLDLSPLTIKRLMNHRPSGDVTEGYIIRDVDRLREPSERIAQLILEVVGR